MIPKTIHYCWFGKTEKTEDIKRCILSWQKKCPEFTIKEWNESNFDIASSPFTQKMYSEKKWAFVADYVRLHTLVNEGGFYLDTDMLILKDLSPLTNNSCVLGEESVGIISAGMIASTPHHPFIKKCKEFYDNQTNGLITIPRALTSVFADYQDKRGLTVVPPHTFYPFTSETIGNYHGQDLRDDTYGVHLWHYSWGHPLNKFFKKIGIYSFGKKAAETLGIKKILKKLLGFI